ncbi:MAG: hypothetical protein SFT90_06545 [Rickettsiales bacterium]|nr:hypothetical protein [Rickettsiales bacterium]
MKKLTIALLAATALTSFQANAQEMKMNHSKMQMQHEVQKNSISMKLEPQDKLEIGKPTEILVKLAEIDGGKPVGADDLKIAHTKKLHLLINDPSLGGYQHIHPTPTENAGEWTFNFIPTNSTFYKVWGDVLPIKTNTQEYAVATMGSEPEQAVAIDKTLTNEANVDGYKFKLSFEGDVNSTSATMGKILIEDANGKPVTNLEPIMGAFAHIVGFSDDFKSIVHIHPMGKEPEKQSERGGPELLFHAIPKTSGFMKLYAQVKINGKEIFAPFGVEVK